MPLVHLLFQLLQMIAHIPRFVIFDFLTLWNEARGPLAPITDLMQEAVWNPNFGFPLVATETPSSEMLVAVLAEHTGESWIYSGQWCNYLFVHNFMLGGNTAYLQGLGMLNRQHGQLILGKGTVRFSSLGCRSGEKKPTATPSQSVLHHRPSDSLSTEVVSFQKQEMTLFLVCGGVWVLCYLHLLAETTSLQSWLAKYEISRRSHEKSGIYICSALFCCHSTFSYNSWAHLLL